MKIALIIGHSKTSQGASNKRSRLTEFNYNKQIVLQLKAKLEALGHSINVVYRRTYATLPEDVNKLNPELVVSFHCNAFNEKASGSEVLYWHKSAKGKKIAEAFQRQIKNCLKLPNRGVKAKTSEDRGGYILRMTKAPCVILEPFFIDNDIDLKTAQDKQPEYINALVEAFKEVAKM